jgi:hypothetical protein
MSIEAITVKPSQLSRALDSYVRAKLPIAIWGSPGIGKSDIVRQCGQRLGIQVKDVRAVLLDPVDLRGLPYVNNGRSHWAVPEFLPQSGAGILFLDELNRAPALVQNACLQLVLDRALGDYQLPADWTIVTALNRESDGGGVTRMNSALTSRFASHFELSVDLEDWCKWAITANLEPVLVAFMRYRPELLHSFDRTARTFPCPRTWAFVDSITKQQPPADLELPMISGAVGHGAAVEYLAFLKLYRSLPSLDAILLNPNAAPVPSEVSALYAVSCGLARRANAGNMGRVIQYLDRLPVEYSVMGVRDAVTRDATLTGCPEFTKWAVNHSDVVF